MYLRREVEKKKNEGLLKQARERRAGRGDGDVRVVGSREVEGREEERGGCQRLGWRGQGGYEVEKGNTNDLERDVQKRYYSDQGGTPPRSL